MNKITKLPKRWIIENKHDKYYLFIKNNEIYFHQYSKQLNKFVFKNVKYDFSIEQYLKWINYSNNDFWYKERRPIIIKALKEEEFNKFIKEL